MYRRGSGDDAAARADGPGWDALINTLIWAEQRRRGGELDRRDLRADVPRKRRHAAARGAGEIAGAGAFVGLHALARERDEDHAVGLERPVDVERDTFKEP